MHKFGLLTVKSLSKKNCGKSWIPIRPDLSPILDVSGRHCGAEYRLVGSGETFLSAMSDSGGAGGVKCYNRGHFPPISQGGRFNYVLRAVLSRPTVRLSKGCHDAVL